MKAHEAQRNLIIFRLVSALYATDFRESSSDARAMSWAKRAAAMFYHPLPPTSNDVSYSLEDLTDLEEFPSSWNNGPDELEEERQRFVRAPPLPRLGKFRRYLDDFKDLGRPPHDWILSSPRGEKHLSREAESFREAVCTEFGDVKEFSLWCKGR